MSTQTEQTQSTNIVKPSENPARQPPPVHRPSAVRAPSVRAARPEDIEEVHNRLMEVIETSPHYSQTFKQYEMARLSKAYLSNLIAMDPFHVMICLSKGETVGFMITGPELGTLWLYWSYIYPEKRRATLAMACFRDLIAHWDNGRFHKISTYMRPGNDAVAMVKRFKFNLTCTLEKHIFGQDYLLYELPLTKVDPEYDHGVNMGRLGRIRGRIKSVLGI